MNGFKPLDVLLLGSTTLYFIPKFSATSITCVIDS